MTELEQEIAHLQELQAKHRKNIRSLEEQLAGYGMKRPLDLVNELEFEREQLRQVEERLKELVGPSASPPPSKRRVQIYLQGDYSSLSADRQSAAIAAFAAVMETSPQAITVYRVYEGSIVFDLGIPPDAAQRLRFLLQSNNAQLRLLGVEKVILEMESGKIEEWVIKEGKFDLVTSEERPEADSNSVGIRFAGRFLRICQQERPVQTVQGRQQKRVLLEEMLLEEMLREVLEVLNSLPIAQTGESGNTMTTVTEVRQEIRPVLALVTSTQERNEDFYRKLLDAQCSIEGAIGDVYRQGIKVEKQGETFLRIWLENIEYIRKEQAEIAEAVNSLRHWAKAVQRQTGLPQDKSLHNAVRNLEQQDLDIRQYLEVNLPLIPGILWYKAEFDLNWARIFLLPLWTFWELFKAVRGTGESMELS